MEVKQSLKTELVRDYDILKWIYLYEWEIQSERECLYKTHKRKKNQEIPG